MPARRLVVARVELSDGTIRKFVNPSEPKFMVELGGVFFAVAHRDGVFMRKALDITEYSTMTALEEPEPDDDMGEAPAEDEVPA